MPNNYSNTRINFIAEMNQRLETAASFDPMQLLDDQKRLKYNGIQFFSVINKLSKEFEVKIDLLFKDLEVSALDEKQTLQLSEKLAQLTSTTAVFRKGLANIVRVTNESDSKVLTQADLVLVESVTKKIEKFAQALFQRANNRVSTVLAKRWYLHIEMDRSESKLVKITKLNKRMEVVEKVYALGESIGKGGEGETFVLIPLDGIGKLKALKVAYKDQIAQACYIMNRSKDLVDKQFVHPITGTPQSKIPGILNLKFIESAKGLGISSFGTGDMKSLLTAQHSFEFLSRYIAQTVFAMNHLHTESKFKPGLIHHDLKLENILYKENNGSPNFFIIDYDGSHELNSSGNEFFYTEGYLSQQDFNAWRRDAKNKQLNSAMDVRALGLCWAEILTQTRLSNQNPCPVLSMAYIKTAAKISGNLSQLQNSQLNKICHLISRMTAVDWEKRPSIKECFDYLKSAGLEMPSLNI